MRNDELESKSQFMEAKYLSLIQKLGVSEEDLAAFEEGMASEIRTNHKSDDNRNPRFDQQMTNFHPKQTNDLVVEDYEEEEDEVAVDRSQSRLGNRRSAPEESEYGEEIDPNQFGGMMEGGAGVISGEQIIEHSEGKKKNVQKVKNIEVLDDDLFESQEVSPVHRKVTKQRDSESGDLLKKLIDNLSGNPALKNESIRE